MSSMTGHIVGEAKVKSYGQEQREAAVARVPCRKCGARVGQLCRRKPGMPYENYCHAPRLADWEKVRATEPEAKQFWTVAYDTVTKHRKVAPIVILANGQEGPAYWLARCVASCAKCHPTPRR